MPLFRRKAEVPFEAVQFISTEKLPHGLVLDEHKRAYFMTLQGNRFFPLPGDWIVTNADGSLGIVSDKIIKKCFEEISDATCKVPGETC